MLDKLKKHGWIGNLAANALQLLWSYPGVTLSAFTAALTAWWTGALQLVQNPTVYIPSCVFLFVLWTYIGISSLKNRKNPQMIRVAHDYAYGLILDGGLSLSVGKFPSDHPSSPSGDAIMITCNYRNVSTGPLQMKVEEFRVILNGRTNDDDTILPELVFPRLAAMGIRCGGVPRVASDSRLSGTLNLKFLYGHPDGGHARRYSLKLKIQVTIEVSSYFDNEFCVDIDSTDVNVSDEPYVTR